MADVTQNTNRMDSEKAAGSVVHSPNLPARFGGGLHPGAAIGVNVSSRQSDASLVDYVDVIRRRKTIGAAVFIAIFAPIALYTFLASPTYRSSAVLFIQDKAMHEVDAKTNPKSDATFQRIAETEVGILRSTGLAKELVRAMKLTENPEPDRFPLDVYRKITSYIEDRGNQLARWLLPDPDESTSREELELNRKENDAVKDLERKLTVRQLAKSQLLQVGMEASSPEKAQFMLKNYLAIYLETKLSQERQSSLTALTWLKEELDKVQLEILESEGALVKFIAENGIVFSEDGGLAEVADMMRKKKESLHRAQELEARLQGLKTGEGTRFNIRTDIGDDEMLRRLKDTLAGLETEMNHMAVAYSPDSPKSMLLRRKIEDLRKRIAAIQKDSVSSALKAAQKEEEILRSGVAQAKEEALRVGGLGAQYAILKKDVDTGKELHKMLLTQYKETRIRSRSTHPPVSVVDPPDLPVEPIWPKRGLFLMIGGILGMFGGLAAVFVSHLRGEAGESTEAVEREYNMVKLGTVPDASKLKRLHATDNSRYEFLPYERPNSPVADSIRNIHTSILFATSGTEDIKSVVVSSATAGEGKTFIAVSLATALTCNSSKLTCCSSKRILVVDCDLRKPSVHHVFGLLFNDVGLSTLLTSNGVSAESVVRKHEIPGLFYIPAGPPVADPVVLLMSDRFKDIVNELQAKFDFIIFDSPPVLGFPEIRILCPYSDGVLLVVQEGRANQFELRSATSAITSTRGGRILGLIVNKVRPNKSQYGYYYYNNNNGNGHAAARG
jgi:capsular exopolysaccharide synthesis family protein